MPMQLSTLLGILNMDHRADPDPIVRELVNDSRQVGKGVVFLAYPGDHDDGRQYLQQALAAGAVACLVEAKDYTQAFAADNRIILIHDLRRKIALLAHYFYQKPSQKLAVIGVTGTNGKTSCCQFLAQACSHLGQSVAVLGTTGNGVWPNLVRSRLTTLDAIGVHSTLQAFALQKVNAVAMEVSSHALVQNRVSQVQFDCAVFTGLTHDHLDYHGDMRSYAQAKYRLFDSPNLRCAVANAECEYAIELLHAKTNLSWVAYGVAPLALPVGVPVVTASAVHLSQSGMDFSVESPWGAFDCSLPLLGQFNVNNILAVIAVLGSSGYKIDDISRAVSQLRTVVGRMQPVRVAHRPLIIVDYAHTPDALNKALNALREHCKGQLWCVFGCGGDRDRSKRATMAAIAQRQADQVIVTADNPRFESMEQILSDIRQGFQASDRVREIPSREQAIAFAVQSAAIDDIVLLAGKGHETAQHVLGEAIPFSDLAWAHKVLGVEFQ